MTRTINESFEAEEIEMARDSIENFGADWHRWVEKGVDDVEFPEPKESAMNEPQAENSVDLSMDKEVDRESIVVDEAVDNEQERVEPQAESDEPAPQKQI